MSESKRDRVDRFIRRAVRRALGGMALDDPQRAEFYRSHANQFESRISSEVADDAYRMKELQDIMDWKRLPKS